MTKKQVIHYKGAGCGCEEHTLCGFWVHGLGKVPLEVTKNKRKVTCKNCKLDIS